MNRRTLFITGSLFLTGCVASGGPDLLTDPSAPTNAYDDDHTAPVITITQPLRPAFVEGGVLRVEGYVRDESPVQLRVGEAPIALDAEGHFSVDIEGAAGAHRFRLVATDAADNEGYAFVAAIMGSFGDANALVPHAVSMHLGSSSMLELSEGTELLLHSMDFQPYLMGANPVAEGGWGELDITSVEHRDLSLAIEPGHGTLAVRGSIYDLVVGLNVDSLIDIRGDIMAEQVDFAAEVAISAQDGRVVAEVVSQSVMLDGFLTDVENFPDFIERLIAGPVQSLVEEKLNEAIAEKLPEALEEALTQVPESQLVDVLGTEVEVIFEVSEIAATPSGIFFDVAAGAFPTTRPTVAEGERRVPGPLRLTDGSAPPRSDSPLSADISLDALNAISFNAWASHALNFRVDDIPFGEDSAKLALLAFVSPELSDIAPLDTPLSAEIELELPPVIVGEDGAIVLRCADVTVNFLARTPAGDRQLVSMSLGINANLSVSVPADGEPGAVQLHIEDLALVGDLYEGPLSFNRGPRLDALLSALSRPVTEKLAGLEGLTIPSVYGFQISPSDIRHQGGFIHFEGTLAYQEPATPAPAE